MKYLSDPFLSVALIATLFNFLLYLINRRTFKILYEKPRFEIREIFIREPISEKFAGGTESFIDIVIFNPSSSQNLVSFTLTRTPFGLPIGRKADYLVFYKRRSYIKLPAFDMIEHQISLNEMKANENKNKFFILTLIDAKRKKIRKRIKLNTKTFFELGTID